jgi:hypothetical protein
VEPPKVQVTGATQLTATLAGDACDVTGAVALRVTRTADGATADGVAIGPGRVPDSREIAGTLVAPIRVHRVAGPPLRIDLLDASGVPLARLQVDDGEGRVADASRALVATIAPGGAGFTATDAKGGPLATITGAPDLEIATLLVAPGVPAAARALLACERLLAEPVVPR